MHLFYTPDLSPQESLHTLGAEESRHAAGVLRLRAGERVRLTDGRGAWCEAEILPDSSAREVRVRIVAREAEHGRRPYRLHVAIAPTKNSDRYEWFLEKATEIGVDRITPLLCEHSERKAVRRDRGEKIVLSAVKQSLKAYVPRLDELTTFRDFLADTYIYKYRFVAHCDEATPLQERVELSGAMEAADEKEFCVLIGPEGDFSPAEIAAAKEGAGFVPVSLGESRLRTETAGVMAAAMAQLASGVRGR
jgi:16S rRNA (uracil1498-N3)-methyltransferase